MNSSEILGILTKVCSDLAYIEESQALQEISEYKSASPELLLTVTTVLDLALQLRLQIKQVCEQQP